MSSEVTAACTQCGQPLDQYHEAHPTWQELAEANLRLADKLDAALARERGLAKALEKARDDLETEWAGAANDPDKPRVVDAVRLIRIIDAITDALEAPRLTPPQACECDKLPKTADGKTMYPAMEIWCVRTSRWNWIGEKGTSSYRSVEEFKDYPEPTSCMVAHLGAIGSESQRLGVLQHGMSLTRMSRPEWCYSTRAAAESAKPTGGE